VNKLAITDVHTDMGNARVQEDQVARLQIGGRYGGTGCVLSSRGAGKANPSLAPGSHHEARAIVAGRAGAAPDVGLTELSQREIEGALSAR